MELIKNVKNFFNYVHKLIDPYGYIVKNKMMYPVSFHPIEQMILSRSFSSLSVSFYIANNNNFYEISKILKKDKEYETIGRAIIKKYVEKNVNCLDVILFDKESLREFISFYFGNNNNELNYQSTQVLISEATRILHTFASEETSILKEFPHNLIGENFIKIFQDISPERAVVGNPPQVYDIKNLKLPKIPYITIHTNPVGQITSVTISGKHPNAQEDGTYCLGNLRFKKANSSNIKKVIENIKVYNLTSCYFIPNELKYLLDNKTEK